MPAAKFMRPKSTRRSQRVDWDDLYTQFATAEFIQNDPIQLPWRFADSSQAEREFVSFLVCMFAYGGRGKIIETMGDVLDVLGPSPLEAVLTQSAKDFEKKKRFRGFYYRFNTRHDLLFLVDALRETFRQHGTLEACWQSTYQQKDKTFQAHLSRFQRAIISAATLPMPATYGMQFMFAEPAKNSAAKRLNMFLRWVVRSDAVDQGLWQSALSPSELLIPLDTHVSRLSREYGLTARKSNDWKTAEEITQYFRRLCPNDPVKYDLAMMGLGTTTQKTSG